MVRLASQTATHKLVQIMGLLVIPIVVLLTLYFLKSKTEIDVLTQERAGVALAHWALAAPKDLSETDAHDLATLEATAGIQRPASAKSDISSTTYLATIGMRSHVLLDAEPDVQSLASVAFDRVPSYLQKLNVLVDMASTSPNAEMLSHPVAEVQSGLKTIENELQVAGVFNLAKFKVALAAFQQADVAVQDLAAQFSNPVSTLTSKQLSIEALKRASKTLAESGLATLQSLVLTQIDVRLAARSKSLWLKLGLLLVAGLTSAMTGIGLAVLLMRSSFLRLDELESARQDAIAARAEAENIAMRFTAINADISRLNQDMALKVTALKNAQEELVKKGRMEQLGQLIATIAHEVRNPLGAIRTTAFMVERRIAGKDLGLEGHLQRINNSVNRCDTIIAQLLDFSRTREINTTPMLFDDWVAKTVREEAANLPDNILIECALGLEGETVHIDPVRMQRALINLLKNASEALLGQQDRVAAGSQLHHHIWVSTKRLGDHAVIRISDNGPGIAAEYIQKIREPLFTTKSFGTGLGIPAVEQVVNQHGGRLDISSDIGKGAVFSIHLPLPRQGAHAA